MRHIANKDLKLSDVPAAGKEWGEFALTFNGYEIHGDFAACAAIANRKQPQTLTDYRTCLFFEQRRWRHFDLEPKGEDLKYISALLKGIRTKIENEEFE